MSYGNVVTCGRRAKENKKYPAIQAEKEIYRAIKKIVPKDTWISVNGCYGDRYFIGMYGIGTYEEKYGPNGNVSTQIIFSNYLRKLKGYEVEIENMNIGIFKIIKKVN